LQHALEPFKNQADKYEGKQLWVQHM